jgi:UDP-glucose 4-epimerase
MIDQMSVLVVGGAGYIGSATVQALHARGDRAVVLDNLSTGHRAALSSEIPFYKGDMADRELVGRIVEKHSVRQVIHFAALTSVPESVERPDLYFTNNCAKTLGLLEALREKGVDRFIFSSTAAVYGEPQHTPIDEEQPIQPTNPYGLSKHFVEQILKSFDRAFGLRFVALRYFNAAGGSESRGEDHCPENHLIPIVLQVALGQRASVSIFGDDYPTADGTCVRDYIHVEDLAQAHLLALDYLSGGGQSQILNLGNGQGYSVREVIERGREVTGCEIPLQIAARRAGDPSILVASSSSARSVLGWSPKKPDLRTIIEGAWGWHRSHPKGYNDGEVKEQAR